MKEELKLGGANVRISNKDPSRVIVTGRDSGLHFILAKSVKKQKKGNGPAKEVYVPVTVLAPGMYWSQTENEEEI